MSLLIDLGEERAAVLTNKIQDWQPLSRNVAQLETDLNELFDLLAEMDAIPGQNRNRKLEDFVNIEEVRADPRFIARVQQLNAAGAGIIACDHYGDCLISFYPEGGFETGHIDEISEEITGGAV